MKEHTCRPTNEVFEILNDTDLGFEIIKEEMEDEDREKIKSLKEELLRIQPIKPSPEPIKIIKFSARDVREKKRNYCHDVVRRVSGQL